MTINIGVVTLGPRYIANIHYTLPNHSSNVVSSQREHKFATIIYSLHAYMDKWKNLFYEMKGEVGMSRHEKERH